MDGRAARPRQRLQHARPGEGPVLRAGKLHRQRIDEGGGRRGMPQFGHRLLRPEEYAGHCAGDPIVGQQPPRQSLDRVEGDDVPNRRQARDLH